MILVIDNYDSFTYNLVHYFFELGADVTVRRNDALSVEEAMDMGSQAIVLSPGPCTPNEAGICLDLVHACAKARHPLIGVCLGHQSIGQAFGGEVVRAPTLMHGKVSPIAHNDTGVFAGLPDRFDVTRYHSLIVERSTLPACLKVNAWTDAGLIMGFHHESLPIHGVQFHPESIATQQGHALLAGFMTLSGLSVAAVPDHVALS
ncbi:MAG: aminodeoxychorismate/anthranilate synthase component II [Pseudomonadota bacterium]